MTAKLTLNEERAFDSGYKSVDANGVNPYDEGTSPVMYHMFEAGVAVREGEKKLGTWDENAGVWVKGVVA